jgi:hypothetical protein
MIQIAELRLDCDRGSTGLWNNQGQNLSYEYVNLPTYLELRVRYLQAEFDEKSSPYSRHKDDESFWAWVSNQEIEIARDIQLLAGDATRVVLWRGNRWVWVGDVV